MTPPRTSTQHRLPFPELSPKQFEWLCYWWVREKGYTKVVYQGESGHDKGCDIIAMKEGRRYVFQCKRVDRFYPISAKAGIDKILALPAEERPDVLVFLVTASVSYNVRKIGIGFPFECEFFSHTDLDFEFSTNKTLLERFFHARTERLPSPRKTGRSVLHWLAAGPGPRSHFTNLLMRWGLQRRNLLGIATVPPGISLFASLRSAETLLAAALEQAGGAHLPKRKWLAVEGPVQPFQNSEDLYANLELMDEPDAAVSEGRERIPGFVVTFPATELSPEDLKATAEWCARVTKLPGHSMAAICIGVTGPTRAARETGIQLAGVLARNLEMPIDLRISSPDLAELPIALEDREDSGALPDHPLRLLQPLLHQLTCLRTHMSKESTWTGLTELVAALEEESVEADCLRSLLQVVLENAPAAAAPLVREMARNGNRSTRQIAFAHAVGYDRLVDAWLEGTGERLDHLPSASELIPTRAGPSPRAALVCGLARRWLTVPTPDLKRALVDLTRNSQPELQRTVAAVLNGSPPSTEFFERDPGSEVLDLLSRCWPQLAPPVEELSAATRRRPSFRRFVESLRVTEDLLKRVLRLPPSARAAFGLDYPNSDSQATPEGAHSRQYR